jgi:hypothetical protein
MLLSFRSDAAAITDQTPIKWVAIVQNRSFYVKISQKHSYPTKFLLR